MEVIADNTLTEDSSLHVPNDYETYGSIIRPVIVEYVGDCYIERLHFTPS